MSTFEKFVRVVQPWIFSRRYPHLKVEIEPQTRALFDELKTIPTIVCPNHCRHEDGELLFLISILTRQQFKFLAAREMFNSYFGFGGFVLRQLGCFEVNRGGENPDTIRATEHQLTPSGGKVVIFPEGEIGYDNDHLEPLEPGAVAIGLDALIRLHHHEYQGDVLVLPLALSYQFDHAEKVCSGIILRLESKFALTPMTGSLHARARRISEAYLTTLEQALRIDETLSPSGFDERVAKVFQISLQKLAELMGGKLPTGSERHQLHHVQSRIFAKRRKASFFQRSMYKHLEKQTLDLNRLRSIKSHEFEETSSLDSLADVLRNLDFLITGHQSSSSQTVVVSAAEPLKMRDYVDQYRQDRDSTIEKVTEELRSHLQEKLQEMRVSHSLSDFGGNSLTLRNNM
ncbi:MAG: 1-acyl-sn-glycerol-3-phosphate acyltransferase [Cyanobacteria bacterium SZAS-4]|nr:1-acyl-sn-glycerol-3-phosphate acyltransferase [Cyanobacteria bacterium SZAS-4]